MIFLGGIPFEIGPPGALTDRESKWIMEVPEPPDAASLRSRPFRLTITENAEEQRSAMEAHAADLPASISCDGPAYVLTHRMFSGRLDPIRGEGTYFRLADDPALLRIILRTAMCCRLAAMDGLPLHAAAVVINGKALIFFGPSGAGKSTIAATSPFPVLSDELVAVTTGEGILVRASGFWGTFERKDPPLGPYPVAALLGLRQESGFRLSRLPADQAMKALVTVVIVPPAPQLWSRVIGALGLLVKSTPIYDFGWSPAAPPWDDLVRLVAAAA